MSIHPTFSRTSKLAASLLLLLLAIWLVTVVGASESQLIQGGGVLFDSAARSLDRALAGDSASLHFSGTGSQAEVGVVQADLQLEGDFGPDASGSSGFVGSGELQLTGAKGEQLRLFVDLTILTEDRLGRPIPAPYPIAGRFDLGGGSAPFDVSVGYGRISGGLTRAGSLIYSLEGERVGPSQPEGRDDLPGSPSPATGARPLGRSASGAPAEAVTAEVVFVDGVRFGDSGGVAAPERAGEGAAAEPARPAGQADPQAAFRMSHYEQLNLPLGKAANGALDAFEISGVVPVFVDWESGVFSFFAPAASREAPSEVVLTGAWREQGAPHLTVGARLPEFELADWNRALLGSGFDTREPTYATVLFSNSQHTVDTALLPGPAADFYDSTFLTLEHGWNFYRRTTLYELANLTEVLRALGVRDTPITLQGSLQLDGDFDFPFDPAAPPHLAAAFLQAQLPPLGPPVTIGEWPEAARESIRATPVVERRLELSHADGASQAWLIEHLRAEVDGSPVDLRFAIELKGDGAGVARASLAGRAGTGWRPLSLEQAAAALGLVHADIGTAKARVSTSEPSTTTQLGPYGQLSLAQLTQLLQSHVGDSFVVPPLGGGLPTGAFDLRNVNIEIVPDPSAYPSFTVTATATILGTVTTEVLISTVNRAGSTPDILFSLRPQQLTFGQIYPGSAAGHIQFPQIVLTYLEALGASEQVTIASASLGSAARAFYSPVFAAGDFTLELEAGVNVVATYPLTQLPSLVVQTLRINPSDLVIVEGSLGMSLSALATGDVGGTRGMYVKATLPTPSSPPAGFPAGLQSVRLTELSLELAYLDPEVVARVGAAFETVLDGQTRRFVGSTIVSLGAAPASILLVAAMEELWTQPFGVSWLDLESVGALLWFNTDGSSRGEFFGLFELAGRTVSANVELTGSSAGASIEFTGLVDQLYPGELADLFLQHSGFGAPGGGLPLGIVELRNVTMRFAAGGDTSFDISADAVYEVQLDGQLRRFYGPAELNLGGGELAVSLDAGLEGPWHQPFGLSWLTLEDVSFEITAGGQQATGTYHSAFLLGNKRVDLQIEVMAGPGGSLARLSGSVDQLSMQDFTQLVQMHLPTAAPFESSSLDLSFSGVTMTIEVGYRSSFSIGATTTLNGKTADLLFSATTTAGKTHILTGFQLNDWSLSDPLPALKGSVVEQLPFDTVALLLTKATGTLDSSDLSPEAYMFFRKVQFSDQFDLKLQPGVSLVGVVSISDTSPFKAPLGVLGSASDRMVVAGSLPGSVLGLGPGGSVSLRAALPPMAPTLPDGSKPPWFRSGQLAFFLEAGQGGAAAGIDGTLDITIDGTDMDFTVTGEFGGTPLAVTLSGQLETEQPWVSPFGVGFLTVRELGLSLSVNPATASLGFGFNGEGEIASKNLEVDIALALNVATGVPTNFVFRAASTSTFSLADLILLQQQSAAASGGPSVPSGVVPALEIRPIDGNRPIEVKFALQDTGDVRQGLALRGSLWAGLAPGAPPELIAEVDVEVSLSRIYLFGHSPHSLGVAQLSLNQPTVSVLLEPILPSGQFVLRGEVVFPWFTQVIDVELSAEANVDDAIQTITSIVATWNRLVTDFGNDPVGTIRSSLSGPGGMFDVAGLEEPPWLPPLFDALDTMQDLFPSSDSATLLDYALAGASITIPAGQGFPAGGRNPEGCPLFHTLYQGRCWTETPFAGEELGYSYICPTGIKEGGRCWLVPPSATSYRGKESYCCSRNWLLQCTRTCRRCPFGTVESGGRCYYLPAGPPRYSSPSYPQKTCFGEDVGGKCWKLGRAPRVGKPTGGADQVCPIVAPVYSAGKCWVVPPTPSVQVDRIPGVCDVLGISCSVDGLLTGSISGLIEDAVRELIGDR